MKDDKISSDGVNCCSCCSEMLAVREPRISVNCSIVPSGSCIDETKMKMSCSTSEIADGHP